MAHPGGSQTAAGACAVRSAMATRGDAGQAARDGATATAWTLIELCAEGAIAIGTFAPVVGSLCKALLKAKSVVDAASRNKEELEELIKSCEMITVQVIDKAKASKTSTIDVEPLQVCVDKLNEVAERYHDRGRLFRLAQFRRDGDDIQRLRVRIRAVVSIMGLAAGVTAVDLSHQILASLQQPPKLPSVPKKAPVITQFHFVRDGVVDRVCKILGGDGGSKETDASATEPAPSPVPDGTPVPPTEKKETDAPATEPTASPGTGSGHVPTTERKETDAPATEHTPSPVADGTPAPTTKIPTRPVAALTGQSGAGKTTAAAAMVGERGDRVRALFSDGVVWLRVGRREGAPDQIEGLMLTLANALYEDVMRKGVEAPAAGERGESYVRKIVSREKLRCLVVADDVWHAEVVEKLRETGMWVLLTTREPSMVEPNERVFVDTLMSTEAEDVLRGAAGLQPGEHLCDAAMKILKICGDVAMDTAFVGSWIRQVEPKSDEAWERAVEDITTHGGGVDAKRDDNRLAVLLVGFRYLGVESVFAKELYVELAVFPDGHAFGQSDAAVLLGQVATEQISILERWGVLKADGSEKYRMHDAHVDFARKKLMRWQDVREPAVERWTEHISRLDFAAGDDGHVLFSLWLALKNVGGKWFDSLPYGNDLVQMDDSNPSKIRALHAVAKLYFFGEQAELIKEAEVLFRRALKIEEAKLGPDDLQVASTRLWIGRCVQETGLLEDAQGLFERALEIMEAKLGPDDPQLIDVLHELERCMREAGRPGKEEELCTRALKILEAELGPDDLQDASKLLWMGRRVQETSRPEEAERWFKRALEIREAKLGPDDLQVAATLHDLGRYMVKEGKSSEAQPLFRRALKIEEAKLGPDDLQVALTLSELGRCAWMAGHPENAEAFSKRALEIREAKLGPDDLKVGETLYELGRYVRKAGGAAKAEGLCRRALEIQEANLGPDDLQVAATLEELSTCVREAGGRPGEAHTLSMRAREIQEAEL